MPKRSRLSKKMSMKNRRRKKPYYVTKFYDITPKSMPVTWRVIARTKSDALKKVIKRLGGQYEWRPKVWEEFKAHNLRLATVKRWISPAELKKMKARPEVIKKVEIRG